MDELDAIIEEAVSKQEDIIDAQADRLKKYAREFFDSGKPLKEILNFSDEFIEMIYSHAYFLYQSAKYQRANHLFRLLTVLCPTDLRFYLGVAACFHQEKNYDYAARSYYLATFIDPEDPMAAYYKSDCDINLGNFENAKASLRQVIERGISNPKYHVIVDRARLTLEKLEKEHPST